MTTSNKISTRQRNRINGYLFLLPNIIGFAIFTFIPVFMSLIISFSDWDGFSEMNFIGLGNYIRLFSDHVFLVSLKNTLIYTLGSVPFIILFALLVAVALNQGIRGVKFFRAAFFIPHVTAALAIAAVWQLLYHPTVGPINNVLMSLGMDNPPLWLSSSSYAMLAVIIMTIWKRMGYFMVMFLAGLQGIPEVLYEAADIDGASKFRKFIHITVPMLSPVMFFSCIMAIIQSFKVFSEIYALTQGGPGYATNVLVYNIYIEAFDNFNFGYASAQSYILFIIILVVTLLQFRGQKKWVNY
ncbi:carbohydrate ABC transporter permease [Vallitalea okinawensis]|uniref:carbohydrate ABC transporter permease n=1 Tax=Vallitalea okinawensis TaxID=2078660 RepID=UPI000CFE1AD4|nr:sugar ABC transporter permease [Vallitalea okinawensis]